jgi:hypothetical protein
MTELSPAARAVLEAVTWKKYDVPPEGLPAFAQEIAPLLAAALRAAADQVVPEESEPPCGEGEPWPRGYQLMADSKWEQRQKTRAELLAIAAELETSTTETDA